MKISSTCKIGLIGNMNNNNFSILRYLLDLNINVDLVLMADDGVDTLEHFHPKSDTWNFEYYKKHIKFLDAPNRFISVVGNDFPWNIYFWLKYYFFFFSKRKNLNIFKPINKKQVKKILKKYDVIVGSGVLPGMCENLNIKLDVFYPYSLGIEFYNENAMKQLCNSINPIKKMISRSVRKKQIQGIINTHKVINTQTTYTDQILNEIGVKSNRLGLPYVYKDISPKEIPKNLAQILTQIKKYDLKFISHIRHTWVNNYNQGSKEWDLEVSKHNHWIINAYSQFIKESNSNPVLLLSEYGSDWSHTKELCKKLNLEKHILWLPKMYRKELFEIIMRCDVGIGEFYSTPKTLWGSTGLEIMMCGKPLIHGFVFKEKEYEKIYNHQTPPLCSANSEKEILFWIRQLSKDKILRAELGKKNLEWFNKHNGKGLMKKFLNLIAK